MKALFLKEFKQGRPLLLFAAGGPLVVALGYAVTAQASFHYRARPEVLNLGVGWAIFCLPVGLALLAGAGLFAGEADRGTMPLLLALPLSRRRIWLSKALAGLALAAVASGLVLGISALLVPHALAALPFRAYALDLVLWMALAFGTAVFSTALVGNTTSALAFAVILAGATSAGTACLLLYAGAPLLRIGESQDIALWGLATAPAFLLASALALGRGELLESGRKWRFAAPAFLVVLVVSVVLVSGVTRFATRYQRSAVTTAGVFGWEGPGPYAVLSVASSGDPIRVAREPGRGWTFSTREESPSETPRFRQNYAVVIGLPEGGEKLVVRLPAGREGGGWAACSPDGRYAAVIRARYGLTWGAWRRGPQILETFDLTGHRRLYSGYPVKGPEDSGSITAKGWSPSGKYLALFHQDGGIGGRIVLVSPDGSERAELPGASWSWDTRWSPTEDVLFSFDRNGPLHRIAADGQSDRAIWTRTLEGSEEPAGLSVSPDGQWVTLYESQQLRPTNEERPQGETRLWAVSANGGEAMMLWQWDSSEPKSSVREAWSADGKTLYLLDYTGRMYQWRPGMTAPQPGGVTLPLHGMHIAQLLAVPGADQILVRLVRLKAETWPDRQTIVGSKLLLVGPGGKVMESLASALAKDHYPLGFDTEGRLILHDGSAIIAADLNTGRARKVYP